MGRECIDVCARVLPQPKETKHPYHQLKAGRLTEKEFSCWIYFLAVRTWPEEPGWLGWGLHDWRSPALHECGACHLAALLRGACTGTERIKRRKTESSRSLRAVLLPAERTPRRPLKVSASHTLLFQSVSGALRVLTRERASESQRALDCLDRVGFRLSV